MGQEVLQNSFSAMGRPTETAFANWTSKLKNKIGVAISFKVGDFFQVKILNGLEANYVFLFW